VQSKDHLSFEELDETLQSDVCKCLQKELGLSNPPSLTGLLEFEVTDLPLREHETFAKGLLTNFLEYMYPERSFRIAPIYRALLGEVAARNNNHEAIASYEDLIRHKSISRDRFDSLLVTAGVSRMELKWETVEGRLNSEQAPLSLVQALRREWEGVELDRLSKPDVVHLHLWEIVGDLCETHKHIPNLMGRIEAIYAAVASQINPSWPFSEMYLKAEITLGIYESE